MIFFHVARQAGWRYDREPTGVLQQFGNFTLTENPGHAEIIVLNNGKAELIRQMEA